MASVVEVGEKLHIITRRCFEEDMRRHFVGEVTATAGSLAELRGYAFVFHSGANEFRRHPEERRRRRSEGARRGRCGCRGDDQFRPRRLAAAIIRHVEIDPRVEPLPRLTIKLNAVVPLVEHLD